MPTVLILLFVAFLTECKSKQKFDHEFFEIGVSQGILDNRDINEASGLVASISYPGNFWTHNDSGDSARIFLIDDHGKYKATVMLNGINTRDCEDIAIGTGPKKNKNYVYLADIGDNLSLYDYKYIYRFEEPVLDLDHPAVVSVSQMDSIKFRLPDGRRDTEAIMIDPRTKDLYIFSKREPEKVNLYVLPFPQSCTEISTAEFVMHIPIENVVAADVSSDGSEILVKNYPDVFYWKRTKDQSIPEALSLTPAHLPYAMEPQGEAIAFDRRGRGYYTVSEEANKKKPHLMFYKRK